MRSELDGPRAAHALFLSIQAQDFIEDLDKQKRLKVNRKFLSIQAQDFIEDGRHARLEDGGLIPEHSSSGLH